MATKALSIFSPAKINLLLAITGRRADGFHELVSVVAPVDFGDELRVESAAEGGNRTNGTDRTDGTDGQRGGETGGKFGLECEDAAVPRDGTNLVFKAAEAFRGATGWCGGAKFFLEKRIPIGAGLGGGSSNAAAALKALNQLAGGPLDAAALAKVAAGVGSDCALFLHDGPVVMRGRGERVTPLAAEAAAKLRGRRVLVFKPAFGISTAWAYGRMAAGAPESYLDGEAAEARVAAFANAVAGGKPWEKYLVNNMEPVAFRKFPALPVLLEQLEKSFGLAPRMSGSGSACFALLDEKTETAPVTAAIRSAWGESTFVVEARLR